MGVPAILSCVCNGRGTDEFDGGDGTAILLRAKE